MTEWISVDDRLPEKSGRYYTFDGKPKVFIGYFNYETGGVWERDSFRKITHWAEIEYPEPPLPEIKRCPLCNGYAVRDKDNCEQWIKCESCFFMISGIADVDHRILIEKWNSIERD